MDPNNSQSNNNTNSNDMTSTPNMGFDTSTQTNQIVNGTPVVQSPELQQPIPTFQQVPPVVEPALPIEVDKLSPNIPEQFPTFNSTEANQPIIANEVTQPVAPSISDPSPSTAPVSSYVEPQPSIDQPPAVVPVGVNPPEKNKMSVLNMILLIMAIVLIITLGFIAFTKISTKTTSVDTSLPVVLNEPTEEPVPTEMPVVIEEEVLPTEMPATESADVIPTTEEPTPTPNP